MKPTAIATRMRMVNSNGRWLTLLSAHNAFHSSLRFFFITMARRKGAMNRIVRTQVMALAYQWSSHPGSILRTTGSTKVNITVIMAAERME